MDASVWERHANPWSVWTRVPILPVMTAIIYYRELLGWWTWLPIGMLLVWTWYNPRAFPKPRSLNNWGSRAVLGERVWLKRQQTPIPSHHAHWANGLSIIAGSGVIILAYGLWQLEPWATVCGLTITVGAKMWFLDRMNWLLADMREHYPHFEHAFRDR